MNNKCIGQELFDAKCMSSKLCEFILMFGIQQKSTPAHCIAAWVVYRTISCSKPRVLLCIVH